MTTFNWLWSNFCGPSRVRFFGYLICLCFCLIVRVPLLNIKQSRLLYPGSVWGEKLARDKFFCVVIGGRLFPTINYVKFARISVINACSTDSVPKICVSTWLTVTTHFLMSLFGVAMCDGSTFSVFQFTNGVTSCWFLSSPYPCATLYRSEFHSPLLWFNYECLHIGNRSMIDNFPWYDDDSLGVFYEWNKW